jgi:serine-type D-Ala-D-Ala carboxypeptidase/endopeptidase (penicillin-binding protein 4)
MKIYFLALALLVFGLFSNSFASSAESILLSKKIDELLKEDNFAQDLNIGILVQDAKTKEIFYKRNADRYFMPASNEKLFTAFTALHFLGANFNYKTNLFIDKTKIKNGILDDNAYWQFTGDPSLTIDQLESLINSLVQLGVKKIAGQIVIDDTAFDNVAKSPGTAWDDQDFCWGSPISALIINRNCVSAKLIPTKINQPARLELPPNPQSMRFANQVVTESANTNCVIKVERIKDSTYKISGCIKKNESKKTIEMAVQHPRRNMQLVLAYLFKKNNIEIKQKFEFKKLTLTSQPYVSHTSLPLSMLITTMLKDSDNSIADAIFKTIGSIYTHDQGSFTNGNKAVREILFTTMQLDIPKTTIIDGSGVSRYNFLTPQQIVTLLQKIYSSPMAKNFLPALAISGTDGTLKDRMKEPLTLGKIYAKTGSETAVSSLSGYLETTNTKRILIFSIMINGFIDSPNKYKLLEDKICQLLVKSL